jgi:hypothetical protein
MLITKDINIENLIIYIEFQIESNVLNVKSPELDDNTDLDEDKNTIIQFKYREITNKKRN